MNTLYTADVVRYIADQVRTAVSLATCRIARVPALQRLVVGVLVLVPGGGETHRASGFDTRCATEYSLSLRQEVEATSRHEKTSRVIDLAISRDVGLEPLPDALEARKSANKSASLLECRAYLRIALPPALLALLSSHWALQFPHSSVYLVSQRGLNGCIVECDRTRFRDDFLTDDSCRYSMMEKMRKEQFTDDRCSWNVLLRGEITSLSNLSLEAVRKAELTAI